MHINECLLTYNPKRLNKVQYRKWYRKFTADESISKIPSFSSRMTHTNHSDDWHFYQFYDEQLTGLEFLQKLNGIQLYCSNEMLSSKYWNTLLNTIKCLRSYVRVCGYRKKSMQEIAKLDGSLSLKTNSFDFNKKQPDIIISQIYVRHVSMDLALLSALDQSKNLRDISEVILRDYSDRPVRSVRKLIKKKQNIFK